MPLLKVSLLVTLTQFVLFTTAAKTTCETNSFAEINIKIYDERGYHHKITVAECVSPSTMALEVDYTTPKWMIKINEQPIPILKKAAIANLTEISKLELQNNNITIIETAAFSHLTNLELVYLSNNTIRRLEDTIFINSNQLRQLHLDWNELHHFEAASVNGLKQLNYLTLAHNSIGHISSSSFALPSLMALDVSHNRIRHIHSLAFEQLNSVEYLNLGYNHISQLSDDLHLPKSLRVLNLYGNNLTFISNEALQHIAHVREVMLMYNPLTCGCYHKIVSWAAWNLGVILNNYQALQCKTQLPNEENFVVCIETNTTDCIDDDIDLYEMLHSQQPDYECERPMHPLLEKKLLKYTNCCVPSEYYSTYTRYSMLY